MAYSPIEESYMNGFVSSQFETPVEPEPVLLAENTGAMPMQQPMTDTGGGAAVGTRLKMPSGLNTPENMRQVGSEIIPAGAAIAKGAGQASVGMYGDIEGLGRMVLNYMGVDVNKETKLPTTEEVKGFLDKYIPVDEKYSTFEKAGELASPAGAYGLGKAGVKAIKSTKGLPVGMSIKDVNKLPEGLAYQGEHKPPMRDSGASLDDVTGGGNIYPEDVYGPNGARYYGDGSPMDNASFAIVKQFKGQPDATVTIYRAIPATTNNAQKLAKLEKDMAAYMRRNKLPQDAFTDNGNVWYDWAYKERDRLQNTPDEVVDIKPTIQQGDWVTINRQYAKEHGEGALNGDYKIISKKVKASDIFTNGDSIHEWGYDPSKKKTKESK